MPKRSNEFQQMIFHLESVFAPMGARVIEPRMVKDLVSGEEREIDIAIETTAGHHPMLLAVECQDRKRPADVTWIEQLLGKYQHLPVDKVIAVTRNGFSKLAEEKARINKIVTKRINQVKETRFVPTHQKRIVSLQNAKSQILSMQVFARERGAEMEPDAKYEFIDLNLKSRDTLAYSVDGKKLGTFARYASALLRVHDRATAHAGINQIQGDKYVDMKITPPEGVYIPSPYTDKEWLLESFVVKRKAIMDARDVELEILEYMGIEFLYGSVDFDEGAAKVFMLYDGGPHMRFAVDWTGPSDGRLIVRPLLASDWQV